MSDESGMSDPYEAVLNDLYAKRDQINHAIAALEAMRGTKGSAPTAVASAAQKREANGSVSDLLGMSIVDAAKKLLAAKRKPLRNPELAALFKEGGLAMNSQEPANTIGSVLTRRFMDVGDVVRVERGTWGLKEWYPNRSFKTKGESTDKEMPAAEPRKEHWKTRQKREREEAAKAARAATNGT
jgi:DNA-directed RNA polymerase delta subunit